MGLIKGTGKFEEGEIINKWLDNRLIRKNKNVLTATTGPTGCLSENTIVAGQTKTLGQLFCSGKRFIDTISMHNNPKRGRNQYYPNKSKSEIIDSGIKEVYEVELEDGRKIIATEEHKLFKQVGLSIKEEEVINLKIGDSLAEYDYSKYYNNAKNYQQDCRDKSYDPRSICKKCDSLFYQENKGLGKVKPLCKNCLKKTKTFQEGHWFEWEHNILKQFYFSSTREKLMELLPLRKNFSMISHKALRLNLKRDPKFQYEKNAFTSENNPMKIGKYREKSINSLKEYYKTHNSWNKGINQWSGGNHPRGMLGKHHTEEVKDNISKNLSGDKGPNWLGGISFEPYDYNFNKRFKKFIRTRDDYCCQVCGKENSFSVHHIDYNKFNSDETNCITLCRSCHAKTNFNRNIWKIKLSNLLINKHSYIICNQQRLSQ